MLAAQILKCIPLCIYCYTKELVLTVDINCSDCKLVRIYREQSISEKLCTYKFKSSLLSIKFSTHAKDVVVYLFEWAFISSTVSLHGKRRYEKEGKKSIVK